VLLSMGGVPGGGMEAAITEGEAGRLPEGNKEEGGGDDEAGGVPGSPGRCPNHEAAKEGPPPSPSPPTPPPSNSEFQEYGAVGAEWLKRPPPPWALPGYPMNSTLWS